MKRSRGKWISFLPSQQDMSKVLPTSRFLLENTANLPWKKTDEDDISIHWRERIIQPLKAGGTAVGSRASLLFFAVWFNLSCDCKGTATALFCETRCAISFMWSNLTTEVLLQWKLNTMILFPYIFALPVECKQHYCYPWTKIRPGSKSRCSISLNSIFSLHWTVHAEQLPAISFKNKLFQNASEWRKDQTSYWNFACAVSWRVHITCCKRCAVL